MGYRTLASLIFLTLLTIATGAEAGASTLRGAAARFFDVGVGISDGIPRLTNDWGLLQGQFNSLTPENCMKPMAVQASEGNFNFAQADAFVDFASSHGL